MTAATLTVLLGAVILIFFEAAVLHFFNRRLKIAHSTYGHCLVISACTAALATVFQVCEYAFPSASFFTWCASMAAVTLLAYYLYEFYFKAPTLRFFAAWILTTLVFTVAVVLVIGSVQLYVIEPVTVLDNGMAPLYHTNDYVFVERYDRTALRGEIVLVYLSDATHGLAPYEILRVRALPGEMVNGHTIPAGSYYVANDVNPGSSGAIVPASAIEGKPVLNLGSF